MVISGVAQLVSRQPEPNPPGISVVVPSFNHAPFVETCLRSIFKQTLRPLELIVIDDGSTDGSPGIIEELLKDCPFTCELISRTNKGLCATLNEGLAHSEGQYFAYLASDDLWLPGFLHRRFSILEKRPKAVLGYGNAFLIDEQNRIIDSTEDWANYEEGSAIEMLLMRVVAPMSPTVLYRRTPLARHGWNENAKLEDYDLYLKLSLEGEFAFDPEPLSAWRHHRYNTSWDQIFMLNERLEAQRRMAVGLGLSCSELAELEKRTKFVCAEEFLRTGEKRKALELIWGNLSGARSLGSTARMLLRLCIPFSIIRRRRTRLQKEAHRRFGTIQV